MTITTDLLPGVIRGPARPDLLRDETLAALFDETARTFPDHPALLFGSDQMTYAELDAAASAVARNLTERGVGPGMIVALWLSRGADLLVAQLAIAKAGAAWLPLDEDTPRERITVCMDDAQAVGLLTQHGRLAMLHDFGAPVWAVEDLRSHTTAGSYRHPATHAHHPAYVIYTSGSTGKPKGIAISQGSICHFLRSENDVLGVCHSDRVYQGFSVSFDMSFEEIWIAYLVGATLWLAPKALSGNPEELPRQLLAAGVTVLHAVPTLLAMFVEDVPSLRLINLGGEACPDALVERWATPERQVFNTYGPTEATVSASLAQLKRGQPVTIGKPLPNYGLVVMDELQRVLPRGETGELGIFGPGVAQGYLGRPELTTEKFIANPIAEHPGEARLYRTGDLARMDDDGTIYCLGRADDQIKIRGFRVELGEIETVLCAQPGIATAAVVVRNERGMDQLIAFYAAEAGEPVANRTLRQALKARLPAYMVPARFVAIDAVPRLTSGKIDRKVLRAMPLPALDEPRDADEPQNDTERALFTVLAELFPDVPVRLSDDFFDDLGGHSLLAAQLVSRLRGQPAFANVAVADVYRIRRIGALAEWWRSQATSTSAPAVLPRPSAVRRVVCGVAQAMVLPPLLALQIATWLVPFFTYHYFTGDPGDSRLLAAGCALAVYILCIVASLLIGIAGCRMAGAGLRAGRYPLWGRTYFRWWLADRFAGIGPVYLLANSPLANWYWRARGVRIGRNASLGAFTIRVPTLLTLCHGVSIGTAVNLENARVERGELHIGPIVLHDEAYVGPYAVIEGHTSIGPAGRLDHLSSLAANTHIPAGECWHGSPAGLRTREQPTLPPAPADTRLFTLLQWPAYIAGIIGVATLFFLPLLPTLVAVDLLDDSIRTFQGGPLLVVAVRYFFLALPASALLILSTVLLAALMRRIVLHQLPPGRHAVNSWLYFRKWVVSQILDSSLHVLHGVYATIYAPFWYRLLGANIGKRAEISSAMGVVPDLLTLGDESFVADAVILGDEEVRGGWMTVRPTVIGHRSFIGNGACITEGSTVPDNVLIGVQSSAPEAGSMQPGQTWLGSPAMLIPARQATAGFAEHLTFRPSLRRQLGRALFEGLRIITPLSFTIAAGYVVILEVIGVANLDGYLAGADELFLAAACFSFASYAVVCAVKWLAMGRYRPGAHAMWTPFVWKSEAVTSLYEAIAVPNFLNYLRGTPMLPWILRSFGVKIGKGTYIDTTDFTEFDCVEVGDYAELNAWSGPQTHLFEDRVMKIGKVTMQNHVVLHSRCTVLFDSQLQQGVELGPLSLAMKGENVPPLTAWHGVPLQPWTKQAWTASPSK